MIATLASLLFGIGAAAAAAPTDYSDPRQVQPFIESQKEKYKIRERAAGAGQATAAPALTPPPSALSSTEPATAEQVQPHIEELRRRAGLPPSEAVATPLEASSGASGGSNRVQPYIESLKAGRELEPKYRKTVNQAAGFGVVASNRFRLTSSGVQANSFNDVYTPDEKYSPSFDFFYERQFLRDPYAGVLGAVAHLGFITTKGKGIFTRTGVPSQDTVFQFYSMPVSLGLSYRFVLPRFLVPYLQLSAVGIPFLETRDDNHPSRRGVSRGVSAIGGVALNLDWIGRKNAWDRYEAYGVLHTYLTIQMEYLRSISSAVAFNYDGLYAGLLFEF